MTHPRYIIPVSRDNAGFPQLIRSIRDPPQEEFVISGVRSPCLKIARCKITACIHTATVRSVRINQSEKKGVQ